MKIYTKGLFREPPFCTLSKRSRHQPLVVAGLLGLSAGMFCQTALAVVIGSQYGQNVTLNDGDNLVADQNDQGGIYGIINPYGQTGNINLGNTTTITVTDAANYAKGILIQGSKSVLTGNGVTINVTGNNAKGLGLSGSNVTADLGTGSSINVEGMGIAQASGVAINTASSLKADNLSITTKGAKGTGLSIRDYGSSADLGTGSTISTDGDGSDGVYIDGLNGSAANGVSRFTATDLTIETQGTNAYGMNIQRNSVVNLNGAVINTSGTNSFGIWNLGELTADALTINTTGSSANGLEVRETGVTNIGADSHISSAQAGGIVANGSNAIINFLGKATNRNTIVSGGSYGASAQYSGASVNLENTDITIDRNGSLGLGLWALGGGTIAGNNITINGAAGTMGVYAMANSQIDLTGDLVINMASADQTAIATQNNDGYTASRINASGNMLINGGVTSAGGLIDLTMDAGSVWTGSAYSDNVNGGYLNVAMTDSTWNVTADSNLDKLALTNTTVNLTAASSADSYSTLHVVDLSGNGIFVLRTDIVGEGDGVNNAGDKVVVTGTSSGSYLLSFINRGSLETTGNEVLTVVETADGQATFTAISKVELGGYLYNVRKNGNDWELYSSGTDEPTPKTPTVPKIPTVPDTNQNPGGNPSSPITTTADAGGNFLNVGYLLNYAETQTLMQRMGDIRQSGAEGNAWLRGFGGKFDSFASGKLSQFGMSISGVQFGFDKRIPLETPLNIGTFMGLTKGSPSYQSGDGTVQSHHVGLYSTYMGNNGFYIDGIAKLSRQKNQFSVLDSQNSRVSGTGSAAGVSASLEVGQKFSLNQPGNGFYIEPQAQFTWSHQSGADINASNGLKIGLGSYNSMIGRASTLLGYEITAKNTKVNVYLKTGLVKEFDGDTDYKLNGSPEQHSFKGTWWNNGLGVSAQFNKQHALYLEVDSSTGSQFNQRQVNAGYRFSF